MRTTIDIPEELHERLRQRAQRSDTSVRAFILRAIERVYSVPKKGAYVTGPLVTGRGKLGPKFPGDENPHDLVVS